MEYLMTYGWAILIVIIVAAALWALGVFNPATWQQASATGFSGFQVPTGGWVVNSNGTISVLLKNNLGSSVEVTDVDATVNGVATVTTVPANATLAANGQQWFDMSGGGITAPSSGSSYSVSVSVDYTYTSTGAQGSSTGTITGTAI